MPGVAGGGELAGDGIASLAVEGGWDGLPLCCARGEGALARQAERVTRATMQRMHYVWGLIWSMVRLLT